MDAEEARTIGWALWHVRDDRGKSLKVIAELAGMSKSHLSRIERGERSPTLNEILALADALQISVSELSGRYLWSRCGRRRRGHRWAQAGRRGGCGYMICGTWRPH